MSIRLNYTNTAGDIERVVFNKDGEQIAISKMEVLHIDLSPLTSHPNLKDLRLDKNRLQTIDLTPLSSCPNLKYLALSANQLQNIDLASLSFCSNLSGLEIRSNQLQSIDLSPLSSCANLLQLRLSENEIQTIDLSPLSSCTNLELLRLGENRLQTINLSPLVSCTKLEDFIISDNPIQTIDLSPLGECPKLNQIGISVDKMENLDFTPLNFAARVRVILDMKNSSSVPVISWLYSEGSLLGNYYDTLNYLLTDTLIYAHPPQRYPWSFLYKVAQKYKHQLRVQHDILIAMGLGAYGFIDCDLTEQFLAIPSETNTEDAREILTKRLVEEIVKTVDQGRATTGLVVDEMLTQHGEIAKRAQKIIDMRRAEVEQVRIKCTEKTGSVTRWDLKELYLTAYGYSILTTLRQPLEVSSVSSLNRSFEEIKTIFTEIGLELKTSDISVSGVQMSNKLKQAIWWIVENRGISWSHILSLFQS